MRRSTYLLISSGILVFVCIGIGIIALLDSSGFPVQQIGPFALAPERAAATMLNNRGIIQNFQVHSVRPWPGGRLVVHNYSVQPPGHVPHQEFGYALVELRAGGWSVFQADLHESLPAPAGMSYASAQLGTSLVVYGYVRDPQIHAVEMTADTGEIVQGLVEHNGFVLIASQAQKLTEIRAIDSQGRIVGRSQLPAMHVPDP